jgi:hypothetical protein
LDYEAKHDIVISLPILEVAGILGVDIISDRCATCHREPVNKDADGMLEFNIHANTYLCQCMNEKGNVIALVKLARGCSDEEAVNWLYERFYLNMKKPV